MLNPNAEAAHSSTVSTSIPGKHYIGNLISGHLNLLSDYKAFKIFMDGQIERHKLNKIGEVYHNFENGGFTAVVCLAESHLSIHTWPERNYITFDVFLSNYKKDNRYITELLYRDTITFFDAVVQDENILNR